MQELKEEYEELQDTFAQLPSWVAQQYLTQFEDEVDMQHFFLNSFCIKFEIYIINIYPATSRANQKRHVGPLRCCMSWIWQTFTIHFEQICCIFIIKKKR